MDQEKTKKALQQIAQKENITVDEVINKIGLAVGIALKSNIPELKYFWKHIPPGDGEDSPTITDVIAFLAQRYANDALSDREEH